MFSWESRNTRCYTHEDDPTTTTFGETMVVGNRDGLAQSHVGDPSEILRGHEPSVVRGVSPGDLRQDHSESLFDVTGDLRQAGHVGIVRRDSSEACQVGSNANQRDSIQLEDL